MNVKDQLFQQIMIGSINLIFTLVAMQLVDRLGRRKAYARRRIVDALWLFSGGIVLFVRFASGITLTFFVLAFIATYATTLAPVTWVLISEIFPSHVRGVAASLATSMLWVACFALGMDSRF